MACRITELVINAADPGRLAAFWSEVLGYVELGREDDGSIEIGPPEAGFGGPQPTLVLSPPEQPSPRHLGPGLTSQAPYPLTAGEAAPSVM
jgi:hypothetical protein